LSGLPWKPQVADPILVKWNPLSSSTLLAVLALGLGFENCSGGAKSFILHPGDYIIASLTPSLPVDGTEPYVLPMQVGCGSVNMPCVSVTVCEVGGGSCKTIDHVLVDTGSVGLRIFSNSLTGLNLPQIVDSQNHHLSECQSYADGSSQWGSLVTADLKLGGFVARAIAIQNVDLAFGSVPPDCQSPQGSATAFNGILGVGFFGQDCGAFCASPDHGDNRIYFDCQASDTNCGAHSISVAMLEQMQNPVSQLPEFNNGVILQIPNVSNIGAPPLPGFLILGIKTAPHNTPTGSPVVLQPSASGDIETILNGQTYPAFFDSGSNGIFFPNFLQLPACRQSAGFYCPQQTLPLQGTLLASSPAINQPVQFAIADADQLSQQTGFAVFNNIGGPFAVEFDWGLPFFIGRTVYIGFENTSDGLAVGPYWAY